MTNNIMRKLYKTYPVTSFLGVRKVFSLDSTLFSCHFATLLKILRIYHCKVPENTMNVPLLKCYLFKFNNRNIRKGCCPKLAIKTPG